MPKKKQLNSRADAGPKKINYEKRIIRFILLGGFPAIASLFVFVILEEPSKFLIWILIAASLISWISLAFISRKQIFYPLYTISNLLESLREGDYSLRGTQWDKESGIGGIIAEINTLSETLRTQRIEAEEASSLLRKVLSYINVSVLAFDGNRQLKFLNPAGETLLGKPSSHFVGKPASDIGLEQFLEQHGMQTVTEGFGNKQGHWQVIHQHFRDEGKSNHLLVISDISQALRAEERKAWKNLIRVLGHELNNSLAPIQSIAATLNDRLIRDGKENITTKDFESGLSIIHKRAEVLSRFVSVYSKLAKLPEPELKPISVTKLLKRVVDLQIDHNITILPGPETRLTADSDQLEQLLINLLCNAIEAEAQAGVNGTVEIAWREDQGYLHILVRDQGCGLANEENLFVPFYTTKPNGSGIGLVLCQQIAEAHKGKLNIKNRTDCVGCEARLVLPLNR